MSKQRLDKLAELEPEKAWQSADAEDWNLKWAAHLYRRGAFGAPPMEAKLPAWDALQAAVKQGREHCVEELLRGAEGSDTFNELLDPLGSQIAGSANARFGGPQVAKLIGWWLYRMLHTPHPLLERLTLFWHGHFATSLDKVAQPELMFEQNVTLRRHALGKFGPLVQAISRDPAMLVWLDSNRNIKGKPNENFARELMELFTLGVGNYKETDVREVARAFTGWGTNSGEFVVSADLHDDVPKTVLGRTGNFDGADVLRILLEQPAAPRLIAGKLYRQFVSETMPPGRLLDPLAAELRKMDFDIAAALRMIFHSRLFNSQHAYRQCIKSPVEYVVSLVRAFDGQPPMEQLAGAMEGLGQMLFQPPNVKGWDGGTAWLNSATLLARHNLAWKLLGASANDYKIDPHAWTGQHGGKGTEKQRSALLALLLQEDISAETRKRVQTADTELAQKYDQAPERLRRLAHVITTIPEYQLA